MTITQGLSPRDALRQLEKELARAQRELAAVEASQERPLEEFLINLVAASNEMKPADVTESYIVQTRDREVYPDARYVIHSPSGGYNGVHLTTFTREQVAELDREIDQRLGALLAE